MDRLLASLVDRTVYMRIRIGIVFPAGFFAATAACA